MRIKMRLAALLCALGAAAAAQVHAQPHTLPEDKAPAIWRFPAGLTVTHVPQPPDDVARLLEIRKWKFRLQFTKPSTGFSCRLELREEGKPPVLLSSAAGSVHNTQQELELTVGIVPSEERLEFDVPRRLRITSWCGDSAATSPVDNPFAAFSGPYDDLDSPEIKDALPLLRGEQWPAEPDANGNKAPRILRLVLKIEAAAPEPDRE